MKKPDKIAWSLDKKKAKEEAREQERAKALIGKLYLSFQTELCSKSRKHSEIIAALYKFKGDVIKEAQYLAKNNLQGFTEMSIKIISEKISTLIKAAENATNEITLHVPVSAATQGAKPKSAAFKTREELLAIDFVRHFSEQPSFTGFTWRRVEGRDKIEFFVLANYATGDSWLVGTCLSDYGLEDLPEYTEDNNVSN